MIAPVSFCTSGIVLNRYGDAFSSLFDCAAALINSTFLRVASGAMASETDEKAVITTGTLFRSTSLLNDRTATSGLPWLSS